jgi:hypothetical protein
VSVLEVAQKRQDRLIRVNETVTARGLRLWSRMTADFDVSYALIEPELVTQVTAAQFAAATGANAAASAYARSYPDFDPDANVIIPQSFAGIDGSGREVRSLLHGAVTTTKEAVGAGLGTSQAFESGAAYLAAMIKTALADIGRSSDLTAATGKGFTHYVRVVSSGACSRCAILAGVGSLRTAFKRHPACKCTAAPVPDGGEAPAGFHATPGEYFGSLSPAEQDRVFTKAGAEAIRSGADPVSVVSARRGAAGIEYGSGLKTSGNSGRRLVQTQIGIRPDGRPIMGYVTGEGTTVRGSFAKKQMLADTNAVKVGNNRYRTVQRTRLMPETIVGLTDDVQLRQALLRDAGYMERPIRNTSSNDWIREREQGIREDRAVADAFYRSIGVTL